jgi:hypothetical protein
MRRFLSIAICSFVASPLIAQTTGSDWSYSASSGQLIRLSRLAGSNAIYVFVGIRAIAGTNIVFQGQYVIGSSPSTSALINLNTIGLAAGNWELVSLANPNVYGVPSYQFTWNRTNIGVYVPADPVATNSFSWTFGPQWAGTMLQVRATNGTTLGTWGLPSVIGSNYVLSASIVTNQSLLTGAQVFLDGFPAAVLAMASTNSNLDAFADRPGYALSFGGDYQGGEWQIRRSDGSVAGTGSAATLGTVTSGRVTLLPEGSTGSIWTRVPAGDGMGAVWINSGISVSGNNVTTYNFAAAPAPTPLPTPAFQTNAPAPTITNAPAPTTPGTNTTTPAPVATNDVTVDVDQLQPIPTNDGEQAALDGVRNASEKLRGILDNFRGSFENVAFTFNEFRKFTLGGVGTTCTFTLGDVTINLSNIVPAWLRSGMKLAILIVAVFSMIRYTWDTFS